MGVSLNKIVLWLLMVAQTGSSPLAQERPMERASYRVQLSELSVQSPHSHRNDTDLPSFPTRRSSDLARTVTRRIGNVGRGTKAVNMSLSNVVLTSQKQLRITWSVRWSRIAQCCRAESFPHGSEFEQDCPLAVDGRPNRVQPTRPGETHGAGELPGSAVRALCAIATFPPE